MSRSTVMSVLGCVDEETPDEICTAVRLSHGTEVAGVRHPNEPGAPDQPRVVRGSAGAGDVIERLVTLDNQRRGRDARAVVNPVVRRDETRARRHA